MAAESQRACQPTQLRMGTVVSTNPLSISINPAMAPLESSVLILTSAVIERKIPVLTHTHILSEGRCEEALPPESTACLEDGQALPVENGYIVLNRALVVGDRVILMRVQKGQQFVILSRVFEEA